MADRQTQVKIITAVLLGTLLVAGMALLIALRQGVGSSPDKIAAVKQTASQTTIVPHKALYTVSLASVQSGAGLADINGEMFFKWEDACEAWTSDHRFSVRYDYPEQSPLQSTSHYVSWEAKDQTQLHFSSERRENGRLAEQIKGSVTRDDDGRGTAVYTMPEGLRYDLPAGFMLPSGHTLEILRRAREGEKFFTITLFDGTDADGPIEVGTFIGAKADQRAFGSEVDADLVAADAWKVRMAVFSLKEGDLSGEPLYEIQIVLHENGVVSHMKTDYKGFSVEQKLQALEKLQPVTCE